MKTIIIAYPTVMDGLVLRWYSSERAAESGDEFMSVSRNGVRIEVFLTDLPDEVVDTARKAYAQMKAGQADMAMGLVTHRKRFMGREIEPIPGSTSKNAAPLPTGNNLEDPA